MRIAHISDLHFGSFSLSPLQFFSKRWLGNFNFLLKRKKNFDYKRLPSLIDLFKNEGVTHVIITGDLSVTSRKNEFRKGQRFVKALENAGFQVYTLPGNHDQYTRRSENKKNFYNYFASRFDEKCPLSLREDRVTYVQLKKSLWLVILDTAIATSFTSAQGHFSTEVRESLEKALQAIPTSDTVIMVNHFPLFDQEPTNKELIGAEFLKKMLKRAPHVLMYLHGHTHRPSIADLRPNQLPIVSDTGCTVYKKYGGCHLLTIRDTGVTLDVFSYNAAWKKHQTHEFAR